MIEKLYYWAENLENYCSDNDVEYDEIIEIKRLNFFIGKNNAGKSRFLRNLFTNKFDPCDYLSFIEDSDIKDVFDILNTLANREYTFTNKDGINQKITKAEIQSLINKLNEFKNRISVREPQIKTLIQSLQSISYTNGMYVTVAIEANQFSKVKEKINSIEIYRQAKRKFFNSLYIPILRGMRPVSLEDNIKAYYERTHKDYYMPLESNGKSIEDRKFNLSNIITGEGLYQELKIHLLGEPEQRDLIKDYEERLSQYFFDNETVSLIPKHDQDVVNIKIGKDAQRPIFELGDGLQQAIILTYEAFIKKDEIHAFFIEEPELHMHAGMVRQLMNFYLNETPHYYFFTTHSNHLLDMADESDQVMIQKFVKQPKKDSSSEFEFKIYRCDRDRDLLASLGVRPSSVYLANCTIWVEGITDRLYITKYIEKYLAKLENSNAELYKKYRRFMPNYHYTFVEYSVSNLVHWCFSDDYSNQLEDRGLSANEPYRVCRRHFYLS